MKFGMLIIWRRKADVKSFKRARERFKEIAAEPHVIAEVEYGDKCKIT